ncbi:uncharacterized protein LOC111472233 [Cucurbita maxima]|uniref:Uncharacterized protein LOC111472233 n=1 Tax=Cucurbita maxima TaxID=3661 RepID=A0A6J1IF62_CUCMA|nr:uncharacterized protein LOC111472233 [Cucurbita maxima]
MTNSKPSLVFIVFSYFFFFLCPNNTIQLHRHSPKQNPSMFLLPSISTTKKFFKKTICNFKSFFSNTYHRLPKAAPPFTAGPEMAKDEVQNGSFTKSNGNNAVHFSKTIDKTQMDRVEKNEQSIKIGATHQRKSQENRESRSKRSRRLYEYDERRVCLVAKKIKELEKLDARNVDHSLDIEEILHYYSRLTCPTYLEIVDTFFMDMFAEFCSNSSSSQHNKI